MKPIFDKIKEFGESDIYPFCMPGHKKGLGIDFCGINPLSMDITEIEGLDNLHNPKGIIKNAQEFAAKTFGAEESFFVVNGSTAGLQGAILSCCGDGDNIIVARNCHRSVYSGLIFSGAVPHYIYPKYIEECGFYGSIEPDVVKNAIVDKKDIKAIVITSPTYEGITSDIKKISQIAHDNNIILIVDEAHGAHFKFNDYFPKTALECGADIVVQSLHKTLPSMTQTAILHTQGKLVDKNRLKNMLAMVQTSSPSYVFMGTMDLCRDIIDRQGKELFDEYVEKIKVFRNQMKCLKHIRLLEKEDLGNSIFDMDLGKLVFSVAHSNITGVELVDILREKYNLQFEMGDKAHAIAMTSISDSNQGFLRLKNALFDIDSTLTENENITENNNFEIKPKIYVTPRKAVFSKNTEIETALSLGKVSADFIIPYPPGIPLVAPGEVITEKILGEITQQKKMGIEVIGATENKLNICILDNIN